MADWRHVVDVFCQVRDVAACQDPDIADGQCFWLSLGLQDELEVMTTVDAVIWCGEEAHRPGRPNAWGGHYFIVIDNEWVVDLTARQFWPDTPWPLIEQLDTYRERFEKTWPDPEPSKAEA